MSGKGTLVCATCGGPKKMSRSRVCGNAPCRAHGWRQLGRGIAELNRAKRGVKTMTTIPCPYCGAECDVPETGEIKCPRCKAVIE